MTPASAAKRKWGGRATLEATSLLKRFGQRTVVDGVTVQVRPGEIVGLLGPNGAGKTTTFNMIVGLVHADEGHISLNGVEITRWPMHKRALAGLGYLPQEASAFRNLSVEDNLRLVLETRNLSHSEINGIAESVLRQFGLLDVRRSLASTLSGGERRRVEVARAIVLKPAILLLDEPFTGLDPIATEDVRTLISSLRVEGFGLLLTEHNVRETLSLVDRAYIIHRGQVLTAGPAGVVANDPLARRFFFGEGFRFDHAG
jgi:lipopolysaccharide export system ATP-binding protein